MASFADLAGGIAAAVGTETETLGFAAAYFEGRAVAVEMGCVIVAFVGDVPDFGGEGSGESEGEDSGEEGEGSEE